MVLAFWEDFKLYLILYFCCLLWFLLFEYTSQHQIIWLNYPKTLKGTPSSKAKIYKYIYDTYYACWSKIKINKWNWINFSKKIVWDMT